MVTANLRFAQFELQGVRHDGRTGCVRHLLRRTILKGRQGRQGPTEPVRFIAAGRSVLLKYQTVARCSSPPVANTSRHRHRPGECSGIIRDRRWRLIEAVLAPGGVNKWSAMGSSHQQDRRRCHAARQTVCGSNISSTASRRRPFGETLTVPVAGALASMPTPRFALWASSCRRFCSRCRHHATFSVCAAQNCGYQRPRRTTGYGQVKPYFAELAALVDAELISSLPPATGGLWR